MSSVPASKDPPAINSLHANNDCYSAKERAWMEFGQAWRHTLLRPLLSLLTRTHVSPDAVTIVACLIGLLFLPAWLLGWYVIAFSCLALHVLLDGLDGPLARFQGVASPRGSFTDTCADQIVVFAVTLSWMIGAASTANTVSGSFFIFAYTAVVVFAMIRNALQIPYAWLVRPRFIVYASLAIDVYWALESTFIVITLSNLLLTPMLLSGIYHLRNALPGPTTKVQNAK